MNQKFSVPADSFLSTESEHLEYSIFKLNLLLNGEKPYKIDYHILLMCYHLWKGNSLEEFCHEQTVGYFLLNPLQDSVEAREAFYFEIREFLSQG